MLFRSYLFPDIPESQLGELVEKANVINLGKDAAVFQEGEAADAFYLIRNGMVKISKTSGDKEVVLSYLVAGNFFGESALFSDLERTATVTTIFPSDLIKLSKRDFDRQVRAIRAVSLPSELYKTSLEAIAKLGKEPGDRKALVILGDGHSDDTGDEHDQVVKAA